MEHLTLVIKNNFPYHSDGLVDVMKFMRTL